MALTTAQLASDVTNVMQTLAGEGGPLLQTAILQLVNDLAANAGTALPALVGGDAWDKANAQIRRAITGIV